MRLFSIGLCRAFHGAGFALPLRQTRRTASSSSLKLPGISSYAPAQQRKPLALGNDGEITLSAQIDGQGRRTSRAALSGGSSSPQPGQDGKLPLVASAQGGTSVFQLEPGSYLVHASFGRAGATKRITVGTRRQARKPRARCRRAEARRRAGGRRTHSAGEAALFDLRRPDGWPMAIAP